MTDRIVIAAIPPSPVRRAVGTAMLAGAAALFVWVALARPPEGTLYPPLLLAAGGGLFWLAVRFRQSTGMALELTATELREAGGRRLVRLAEVRAVQRGTFAAKPANGFVLVLAEPQGWAWAPGLWWRTPRRLGVGGATPRFETQAMAEAIARLIERRPTGR